MSAGSSPPVPVLAAHPQAIGQRQTMFGAAISMLGVATAALGGWPTGLPLMVFGGLITGFGVLLRATGSGAPAVNAAFDAVLRGRSEEADRILDLTEAEWQPSVIRRAVDLQRASLALGRGELERALVHTEAALHRPRALVGGADEMRGIASAYAMRALVRVSLGLRDGARADIDAVDAIPEAAPEALARAAVAQAILLERSGDREALAQHLASARTLLLDYTAPRERSVVRAYERMLETARTTVYREGGVRIADDDGDAPRAEEAAEGEASDWLASLARAAPTRSASLANRAGVPQASPLSSRSAGARRPARPPPRPEASPAARMGFWIGLILLFAGVWQIVSYAGSLDGWRGGAGVDPAVLLGAFIALLTAATLVVARRSQLADADLTRALGSLARGHAGALEALEALARGRDGSTAARASLALAHVAERAADLVLARTHVEAGVAAAHRTETTRSVLSFGVLPDLVAERAFLVAANGDPDAADAEMAELAVSFPSYPYMARAELRVGVVSCARRGDLVGAGELARSASSTIPLSHRDETLMDLARAAGRPDTIGAAERDRLQRELKADPELGKWLRLVAPALVRAFESSPMDAPADEATEELDAEREAEALAEALAAEGPRHRLA